MSTIPTGYKQTEVGVIPHAWQVMPITATTNAIFLGLTSKVDYVDRNGIPLIRATDIANGNLSFSNARTISIRQHKELTKYRRAKRGDVLVSKSGSLGVCAIVNVDAEFSIYESIIVLQPNQLLDSVFLLSLLRDETTQIRMIGEKVGSSVAHLNLEMFRKLVIPVPSLPEQRAIAAALSDVDALLAKLDQLIAKKRDLKQATMQQLLTSQTRLPGFSGEWEVKRLGDVLIEIGDGATPSTAKPGNFGGTIAWVVIEDIRDDIWSTHNTLTEAGLQSCAAKLWPTGTLILSTGATIGEVGIARIPLATKQGICGLVFDPKKATSGFMKYWFASNKAVLLAKAQGSSIKEVRAPTLVQFEIALPKVTEQTAIATVLSGMDAELAALEARRDKARALKQGMMQELLTGRIRLTTPETSN